VDLTIRWDVGAMEELGRDAMMRDAMADAADAIARSVRQEAPVDTGDYRDSIGTGEVEEDRQSVYGTVTTSDPAWHLIEYGHANAPAYAPMRAGAEAVGARFRDIGD